MSTVFKLIRISYVCLLFTFLHESHYFFTRVFMHGLIICQRIVRERAYIDYTISLRRISCYEGLYKTCIAIEPSFILIHCVVLSQINSC